jgi:RNA polymerase primary sigma factor
MNSNDYGADEDMPIIDLDKSSVQRLIARAKSRGVISTKELDAALPRERMSTDQIESVMAAISEMGINIVESDDEADPDPDRTGGSDPADDAEQQPGEADDERIASRGGSKKVETASRSDDPVRLYLQEMGAAEVLSREGEAAIAKRIECGRDTMILGLCESPITFHAIIQWSEALNNGEMQLREILDLDAMLSKEPKIENLTEDGEEDTGEISEATAGPSYKEEEEVEDESSADGEDGVERSARRALLHNNMMDSFEESDVIDGRNAQTDTAEVSHDQLAGV